MSTVTMQELELETAELLPARETLCSSCYSPQRSSTSLFQSGNGNGDGNTYQVAEGGGFASPAVNVSALNGNLNGLTIF
jgi:hypothetical protein